MKAKGLVFALLFLPVSLMAQDLPVEVFSSLVMKAAYFNKDKTNNFHVIYNKNVEEKAKKMSKLLGGDVSLAGTSAPIKEYTNVVFIGMTDDQIKSEKANFGRILSISDSPANIENVSLSFGLKDNKRPLILVNLSLAKEEANFKAQFLKIAEVK